LKHIEPPIIPSFKNNGGYNLTHFELYNMKEKKKCPYYIPLAPHHPHVIHHPSLSLNNDTIRHPFNFQISSCSRLLSGSSKFLHVELHTIY